ncbi:MAG TPA: DHA2 family efflux MFS transporter permease subunit [Rhodanobacteraceae bacterium]
MSTDFQPPNRGLAIIGLALATFMQVLDLTIANVSLPTIAGGLGVTEDQSTWVITAYMVCNAIALPLTGFITRRFGEVKPFIVATILFTLASMMCGFSDSLGMLVVFRAIQGLMAGPMYPITQSLMVSLYPGAKRGSALAILAMIAILGPIIGPILGGYITETYSWHWIFFINVPVGAFAVSVVAQQMRGKPENLIKARVDVVGLVTLIFGVGALQILLNKGNQLDWFHSTFILALAIVAAISLTVFLIWEFTDEHPIVNFRLFRHRNFTVGTLAMVLAFSLFFSTGLLTQLWMQTTLGYTALWAGLAVAPIGLFPLMLSMFIGKNMARVDIRWLASFAFLVMGMACFIYSQFNTQVDFYHVAMTKLFQGLGVAFFFLPILTILLSDLNGQEVSDGSGLATFLRTLGGSFAVSIVTYLWDRGGAAGHAILVAHVNAYSAPVRQAITRAGDHVPRYLAGVNREITRQAVQISFNHLFLVIGFLLFALIAVIWLAKPPFIGRSRAPGGH